VLYLVPPQTPELILLLLLQLTQFPVLLQRHLARLRLLLQVLNIWLLLEAVVVVMSQRMEVLAVVLAATEILREQKHLALVLLLKPLCQ